MQALKRVWSEELRGHLQHLAVRDAAAPESQAVNGSLQPQPVAPENVVRAAFPRRESPAVDRIRARPELSAALDAVVQAAEHIKAADERAEQAQRQADDVARRACTQLEEAKAEIAAAQDTIRAVQERADASAQRWADQLLAEQGQTVAAKARCSELEAEIAELNERLSSTETMLIQSKDHIFAAETRALEAREDMRCLAAHIREQFGLAER